MPTRLTDEVQWRLLTKSKGVHYTKEIGDEK